MSRVSEMLKKIQEIKDIITMSLRGAKRRSNPAFHVIARSPHRRTTKQSQRLLRSFHSLAMTIGAGLRADHARHAFFFTSLPETLPDLRDTAREARNDGLDAPNSSSSSSSVCLSSTSPNVAPFLSTILTTRSRGKDSLNVLEFSNRTIISFNKGITIILSPFDFLGKVYHRLKNLSSKALDGLNRSLAVPVVIAWLRFKLIEPIQSIAVIKRRE